MSSQHSTKNDQKKAGSVSMAIALAVIVFFALGAAASFMYYAGPGDEMEIAFSVIPEDTVELEPSTDITTEDDDSSTSSELDEDATEDAADDIGAPPDDNDDITILAPDMGDDYVHPGVIPTSGTYSYTMYATNEHLTCNPGTLGIAVADGTAEVEFVTDGYQALVNLDGKDLVFNAVNAFDTLYYQTDLETFPTKLPDDSASTGNVRFWLQPQTESEIHFWIDWNNMYDCAGFYPALMELL